MFGGNKNNQWNHSDVREKAQLYELTVRPSYVSMFIGQPEYWHASLLLPCLLEVTVYITHQQTWSLLNGNQLRGNQVCNRLQHYCIASIPLIWNMSAGWRNKNIKNILTSNGFDSFHCPAVVHYSQCSPQSPAGMPTLYLCISDTVIGGKKVGEKR